MKNLMVAQDLNDILVVDDTPQNLHLLVDILTKYKYKVRPVPNGKLALSAAEIKPPDLIILDIMMPDLDGYQVCRKLKSNPKTRDIPIIFITAMNESVDKVKAFTFGGADYITKPFQIHDVLIRVKNQLALKKMQRQLRHKNKQLNLTIAQLKQNQHKVFKSQKYLAIEKITLGINNQVNRSLDKVNTSLTEIQQFGTASLQNLPAFLSKISPEQQIYFVTLLNQAQNENFNKLLSVTEKQELRNKLVAKLETYQLKHSERIADILIELGFDDEIEKLLPLLISENYWEVLDNAYLILNLHKNVATITESTARISQVMTAFQDYSSKHKIKLEKRQVHVKHTLEKALTLTAAQMPEGIQIIKHYGNVPAIYCDPKELQKVWAYLIQNAIDAIGVHGILTINIYQQQDNLLVDIIDTGESISQKIVNQLCEPFFTTKSSENNLGLGLAIAKQIIERHDGSITVKLLSGKMTLPGNTKFTVSLPIQ
ncbi:hybrid sensor histidine kinase/response regulator [Pleurocapsales cyanobacterium LEGE 10410]|nr:hybrid sensor histidine kinase/response regulator [Pleurocapsales cyanobacterium LEGE 10410]